MRKLTVLPRALRKLARAVRRDEKGVAVIEFGLAAPVLVTMAVFGLELANLSVMNLRINQMAANLADTTSRVGELSPLALKQIREADINDALQAIRIQGENINFLANGRAILTSLERNANGGQWIRWQRCVGQGPYTSAYGAQGLGATGTAFLGMGVDDATRDRIQAPAGTAVMFVEITYKYTPLINEALLGPKIIRSEAAFLVRDRRDYSVGNNPSNPAPAATASTC